MADNFVALDATGTSRTFRSKDNTSVHTPAKYLTKADGSTAINPATSAAEAPVAPATATATGSVLTGLQYTADGIALTDGQQAAVRGDARGNLLVREGRAGLPTYCAIMEAQSAYATPTDMFALIGSPGKLIRVVNFAMLLHSTSATLMIFYWYKRTVANSGGSPSTATVRKHNTGSPPASGSVVAYTAAPTIDGSGQLIQKNWQLTTATTASPNILTLYTGMLSNKTSASFEEPICLYGEETLAVNLNGASLPSGIAMQLRVEWTVDRI